MSHVWPDAEGASTNRGRGGRRPRGAIEADEVEVRHVQPYQAVKIYRCPGCDHEIPRGQGHEVVVPLDDPASRRHWHTGCWHRETRRRTRTRR